ncbi:50S ribosomal protein L14e [archaeon]|jgi:large subunit ribosomal protein L14e|nr:50S ribosomal protein L14e [archaeon]MBT4022270.1 50S ribosomal protein L14e [archaeon]MBT4272934.1 50S ribosomal protein L14e [archaeon]MBT4460677.1 50S ribosomal protein L14e [archaeon]MBT4857965.1 50S ribosomal protein L14e [archaeon]
MYEIGRLCVKLAGRDARKKCLVVDILENNYVLIDGQTRRKKCNNNHLEPLNKVLKIKKGASHKEVVDALKKEKIEVVDSKPKQKVEKPTKQKKVDSKVEKKQVKVKKLKTEKVPTKVSEDDLKSKKISEKPKESKTKQKVEKK